MEICKKNHWHILENHKIFDNYLEVLGYNNSIEEYTVIKSWFHNLIYLDFLKEINNDQYIEEIILHSPTWIQVFSKERKEIYGEHLNDKDWQLALDLLCLRNKQVWNESAPFASFQMTLFNKKWRATFSHKSLSPKSISKLFLRHQQSIEFKLSDFDLTQGQNDFFKEIIQKKKNVLICGATGSGKTSFLRSLLTLVSDREHITILEDTHEISHASPFTTSLLASPRPGMTLKDYCHYTMRMRPERIILGEIRSDEVVPFLLSINTGHSGMMASIHANSAIDSISRLALLFQIYSKQEGIKYSDIIKMICQGIDYIVHLDQKKVTQIIEVIGCEGTTPYYKTWT
jgi:Flp pilus assembly CpaF family ATPase